MPNAIKMFIAAANILWLVSPPILIGLGVWDWKRKRHDSGKVLPLGIGTALFADWGFFVYFVVHSETPYGMYFRPSWMAAALLLLSLLGAIVSVAATMGRWQMISASVLILSLWVWIGYAPAHHLTRVDFATVTVDNRPIAASVYLGHPTDMQAEAFALVRLEHGSGYMLDFDSGKVRPTRDSEYLRIPGGVWYLRAMQSGTFGDPLPPTQLNQFRVLSADGHVLTVQF